MMRQIEDFGEIARAGNVFAEGGTFACVTRPLDEYEAIEIVAVKSGHEYIIRRDRPTAKVYEWFVIPAEAHAGPEEVWQQIMGLLKQSEQDWEVALAEKAAEEELAAEGDHHQSLYLPREAEGVREW